MTNVVKSAPKDIRKFGITFAVLCLAVAAYLFYKGNMLWPWLIAASAIFLGTGLALQPLLRPLYSGWMKFAFVLGWINTRILLGIFYYLILTPIGVVLRVTGKDLLDERIDRSAKSYWKKRDPSSFNPKGCERQF